MWSRGITGDRKRVPPKRVVPSVVEPLETRQLPSATGVGQVLHHVSALVAGNSHQAKGQPLATQAASSASASTISSSDASTLTVPLKLVKIGPQTRISVKLSVAGGAYRPYLLDTGSTGLYVANNQFSSSEYSVTSKSFDQHYTSGIHYKGPVIKTSVSFAKGETASDVYLGLIESATGSLVSTWNKRLNRGKAPYEKHFYGTLGMSLAPGDAKKQGDLYSIIAQLPGNLHSGFIIHTGGIQGTAPTLTIGLTPENTQGFFTVKMPSANGHLDLPYSYGNGAKNGVIAWNDKGVNVPYTISGMPSFSAPTIFDTGEQNTVLYTGNVPQALVSGGRLISNRTFQANLAPNTTWQFQTGSQINVNQVFSGKARSSGTVNTGIALFFSYDVMYDLADGLLGFRPISTLGTSETQG